MAEAAALDRLYSASTLLVGVNAKLVKEGVDEFAEHKGEFQAMLAAAKAGPKCKQLALSELPKYVSRYPELSDKSLDILTDLFEEKTEFHLKALQGFKVIASSAPGPVILKLVGLLGQMLQTEVEAEIAAVNAALFAALEKDVKATMAGLLEQMGTNASLRAKAVSFIESSVLPRASQLLNESEETQNLIADHLKKVMSSSVSPKEFTVFMRLLFSMNKFKNGVEGANEILDFVHASIDLDKDFSATAEQADRLIMCTGSASLIYKHGASPNKLTAYLSSKVLPKLKQLTPEHQIRILKLLADLAPFIKGAPCRTCLPQVWPLALSEVPDAVTAETKINWGAIECLLYTFHHLGSRVPGFLHALTGLKIFTGQPENRMDEDHSAKLAELNTKMTTLITQSGENIKMLQQVMQKLRQNKPDTPEAQKENNTKIASCQLTISACQNVSTMAERVRKLNLKDPDFLADEKAVKLSYKSGQGAGAGAKRGRDNAPAARGGIRGGAQGGPAAKKAARGGAVPQGGRGGGGGRGGRGAGGGGGAMRGAQGGRGGMRGRGGRR